MLFKYRIGAQDSSSIMTTTSDSRGHRHKGPGYKLASMFRRSRRDKNSSEPPKKPTTDGIFARLFQPFKHRHAKSVSQDSNCSTPTGCGDTSARNGDQTGIGDSLISVCYSLALKILPHRQFLIHHAFSIISLAV